MAINSRRYEERCEYYAGYERGFVVAPSYRQGCCCAFIQTGLSIVESFIPDISNECRLPYEGKRYFLWFWR